MKDDAFADGFAAALAAHEVEIDTIAGNPEPATFDNTIVALEIAGDELSRVSALFWSRAGANTNDTIQALERDIAPKMSRHYSKIGTNAVLFARIDALWEARETLNLSLEQTRVLERHWKGFVKSGAKLAKPEQDRLAAINETLAGSARNSARTCWPMRRTGRCSSRRARRSTGCPTSWKDAMAAAARERGEDGRFAVTLSRSIIEPFLTFSARRDLREQAFRAWVARGENDGETTTAASSRKRWHCAPKRPTCSAMRISPR